MGLFSSSNKNKQDRALDDSGRFYSKDDDAALGERARAKRAGNAGGATRRPGNDPLLPEKKRARRRLVGAIALALAAAVGLPMLLDSEPKPLAGDIAIQIPSKDKAAPLPVPGDAPDAKADAKSVATKDSVDQGEEVVNTPPPAPPVQKPTPAPAPAPAPAVVAAAKPAEPKVEAPKLERKPEPVKPEHKEAKPEHKEPEHKDKSEPRLTEKTEKAEKPVKPKPEDKPAKSHEDAARALAILEDKSAEKVEKADKAEKSEASQKFVLQVVAMSTQEKAAEVQARLREAGISSHTEKATTAAGELIRVKVGPLNREDADKVRAKLAKLGFAGKMSPL